MPEFRGPKNLSVGADTDKDGKLIPAWAVSTYDTGTREYVISLGAADAKKFRALSDEHKHGFREVDAAPDGE